MTRFSFGWFLAQILIVLGWIYFYHGFLKDENNFDFIKTIIAIIIYYLLGVITTLKIESDLIAQIINWLALIICLYLIRRPSIKQLLFSYVIFYVASFIAETLAMLVYYGLNYLFIIADYYIVFIFDITSLIVYYYAIRIYRKEKIDLNINILYLVLLLVINQEVWLSSLSNLILGEEELLTISYPLIIIQILVIIAMSLSLKDYVKFKKLKIEDEVRQNSNEELKRQIESLGNKQSILNKVYKEIQSSNLSYEKLDSLSSDLKDIRMNIYSDNPSVNALLSYFNDECKKDNIKLSIEIKGSLKDKLEDYDLNTLLSNILKNALEASNNIELKIINKNDNILITCVNTNDKKIKKNKLIHGNGTPIIKDIVNKYKGIYSFEIINDIANLKIILNTN